MTLQLPLGLALRDSATFDNFISEGNAALIAALRESIGGASPSPLFLWGAPGTGKTHLLQAACHAGAREGLAVAYLPVRELLGPGPGVIEGMESFDLVCVDDVGAIGGDAAWEQALFTLFNGLRETGGRFVAAGAAPPPALGLHLDDLASRLAWGPVFHVKELADDAKCQALVRRARDRGMEMPEDVARYLLRRQPRDLPGLFALLARLDEVSLAAQRRLTVPFVKQVMEGQG